MEHGPFVPGSSLVNNSGGSQALDQESGVHPSLPNYSFISPVLSPWPISPWQKQTTQLSRQHSSESWVSSWVQVLVHLIVLV